MGEREWTEHILLLIIFFRLTILKKILKRFNIKNNKKSCTMTKRREYSSLWWTNFYGKEKCTSGMTNKKEQNKTNKSYRRRAVINLHPLERVYGVPCVCEREREEDGGVGCKATLAVQMWVEAWVNPSHDLLAPLERSTAWTQSRAGSCSSESHFPVTPPWHPKPNPNPSNANSSLGIK